MVDELDNINPLADLNIYKVHHCDARKLGTIINSKIVDVTITSPPYFDLKDYGYDEQIGYGQSYDQYLSDLKNVFKEVFNCTKDTGTLWVIIDSFKKDGKVVPLPFDFSNKLQEIGWNLQEVIIWAKDRTVPWTHKGQMRNLFEYILMFSKSSDYNFYIDKVRDQTTLKKWWVKYPERYNPKGKAPTGIWQYDIPTQGTWGKGYIKHFCPLPEELIARIIELTTSQNDVVLDPFAGSGAVLAKADNMSRRFIGLELNKEYIGMFENYLYKTGEVKKQTYNKIKENSVTQSEFYDLIIKLRVLKYSRVLFKKINEKIDNGILLIYVERTKLKTSKKNAISTANYSFLIKASQDIELINNLIENEINKAPLSKFNIDPSFYFYSDIEIFNKIISKGEVYTYSSTATHSFLRKIEFCEVGILKKNEKVISQDGVKLNEADYDN